MTGEDHAIVADLALRLDAPRRERKAARLVVAALVALAIDLSAVGLVWVERLGAPPPQVEDIPIEVVVEPPPPPPPPPAAQPSPAPSLSQPDDLKPATDAPREGKSDHDDEHVADKPKPAAAPPPEATPSPEATQAATPPPAPELPKAAEAEAPQPQESPQAEPQEKAPAAVAALPQAFDSVPDIDFGGEAIRSPVTGGAARSNYKTQLYGLISPRLRVPAVARTYGRTLTGVVNFAVDGGGHLTQRYVAVASGSMELDEAVMQAIGAAARYFPKPPSGHPIGLSFTYSVN